MTPVSLQLGAQREGEGVQEGFGAVVDRLEGAGHEAGDRAGDQDAAFVRDAHVAARPLDEIDRAGDVGVDDVPDLFEILVEKRFAETAAGIGEQRIDRSAVERAVEPVDAFGRGQVGLDRLDLHAFVCRSIARGFVDLRLVGGDDEIEAMLRALLGELEADAGRGAGDDGKALRWSRYPWRQSAG